MVQAIIDIDEDTNRVLNIVKARHNLKDKSQAIEKIVKDYGEVFEPEIRPEYLKELLKISKGPHVEVSMDELMERKTKVQQKIRQEAKKN